MAPHGITFESFGDLDTALLAVREVARQTIGEKTTATMDDSHGWLGEDEPGVQSPDENDSEGAQQPRPKILSQSSDRSKTFTIQSGRTLSLLFAILRFILQSGEGRNDYKVALIKEVNKNPQANAQSEPAKAYKFSLGFWCLNPAVTFRRSTDGVRSVILTSGTLSPIGTFASELGVQFDVRAEAMHIIDRSQVIDLFFMSAEKSYAFLDLGVGHRTRP